MMEELQARHRKEQRDLQARITQKKKAATKKTRKGVNDECANLEHELRDRQARELVELNGSTPNHEDGQDLNNTFDGQPEATELTTGAHEKLKALSIADPNASLAGPQAQESPGGDRKPKVNRQKARLARRAAEQEALAAQAEAEAASLPNLREQERAVMAEELKRYGLKEKDIRPDGHCLYSAVADQLEALGMGLKPQVKYAIAINGESEEGKSLPGYKEVRKTAAKFMEEHPDDFAPFLEESLDDYVHKIRETAEWGGQLELLALSKAYGVDINVLQGDGRIEKIELGTATEEQKIWLAYYRHTYGLGEHYNSLRKIS